VTVANRIRAARQDADLTQAELAERVGVPQSSVSRWESGEVDPTTGKLAQIAHATGKPFAWFFGEEKVA
jgi:transcriptional regulator with XRE-family HTH domain